MTPERFKAIEQELGLTHAAMAEALGVAEVSVKRYATGHTIPEHVGRLALALLLSKREGLQDSWARLLRRQARL